ncbi:hypothetical protein ACFVT9_33695 [Kitasatospora cineracea]|uniref:hypothetical protein n=1 Tax=Kitasatospora cineracea TaxID=88074 RepID=UPI00367D16F8
MGLLPCGQAAAEAFYRVIDAAYERRSVVVTSNIHPAKAHMFRRTCARQRLNSTGSKRKSEPRGWTYPAGCDGDIRVGRHPGQNARRLLATHGRSDQRPWRLLRQEPRCLR